MKPALELLQTLSLLVAFTPSSIHAQLDDGRLEHELRATWPAAVLGDPQAQWELGWRYHVGSGVTQDMDQAAQWYRRAALQGHRESQQYLGLLYYLGVGVERDLVRAWFWLDLAARAGSTVAARNRDAVAVQMTAAERTAARRRAERWWNRGGRMPEGEHLAGCAGQKRKGCEGHPE